MKKLILLAIGCFPFMGYAQSSQTLTLNLKQAIKTGLQNRYDVKAKQYNVNLAKNKINQSKKAWIPDIKAEGNIQYNTQIKQTYVPKGFAGFTEPQLLSFGAKNATAFGLSLNQPLFKSGINTDIKIAKAQLTLQKEKIRGNKITIKNKIASAYLDVLLKKLQLQIARSEENRFGKYKTLAEGKYKQGALIENDYLRAKLDYKNAKVNTTTLKQNYKLALVYLKNQINIPSETNLILSDSIGNISFGTETQRNSDFIPQRTEIKQLKLQQQEDSLQLKRMRQNVLPSVSLFGYYAQTYQNQNFRYDESKWWGPHSYVGLKISIPITGNFANKNNIQKYQIRHQQLVLQLQQEQSDVRYQIQKATTDVQNTLQNMQSAKNNYALSQTIYKNQQQQFAIGVFKYSDLLDTEKSLNNAEQNYIRTVYDYLVAELQYAKATGEL